MFGVKHKFYARLAVRMLPRFRWRIWRNYWRYLRALARARQSGPDRLSYFPPDVSIWVTNRCNKHCHFCHYVEGLNAENHRELELTFNRFKELIHLPLVRNCLRLGLYGGEPLLNDELPEMIVYGKQRGHLVTVNTNGLLIKKRLNALLRAQPDLLSISYYPEDRHKTTEAIALVAPQIPVIVNYMYSEARLEGIEEVIQCAIHHRAWAVKLETYDSQGSGAEIRFPEPHLIQLKLSSDSSPGTRFESGKNGLESSQTTPLDSAPLVKEMPVFPEDPRLVRLKSQFQAKYGKRISLFWPQPAGEFRSRGQTTCRTFWRSTWLDAKGQMSPCCVWPVEAFAGNALEDTEPWNSTRMIDLRENMRQNIYPQICAKCSHLYDDALGI